MPRGYERPLDLRGAFETKMFGRKPPLTEAQTAEIAAAKQVIYEGFKAAIAAGVPKEKAGILVDEQFGAAILRDAAKQGYLIACPAEKSGQEEFDVPVRRGIRQTHRGLPPDLLQGARALQP